MSIVLSEHLPLISAAPNGIQSLRNLILELAVRGKLVTQDPNDEPASELLKRIEQKRTRLEVEGVCKKSKPMPPVKEDERPFEIPDGWAWVRWNDIAQKIGDIDHKMPETVKDGVPYVSPRDFYPDNRIDYQGAKKISRDDFLRLSAKIRPEIGDIIYPRYGTIGENRLVVDELEFLASYSCCVIKTLHGFVAPKFQFYFSISRCCRDQAKAAENKTTQANVGIKSIQEFAVPLPPFAEQHRIVTKADELMALCDRLETEQADAKSAHAKVVDVLLRSLTHSTDAVDFAANWQRLAEHFDTLITTESSLDAIKHAILQLAVMGKLVPQDHNDEPASTLLQRIVEERVHKQTKSFPLTGKNEQTSDLPSGWTWSSVSSVFNTTSGNTFDAGLEKERGSIPYVKVGDMNLPGNEIRITTSSRYIDPKENMCRWLIPSGSIIFPKRGGAIATNKKRIVSFPIFVDLNIMAITPTISVVPEYAYLWLSTIDLATLNTGTSVPQINHKDIDPLPFPLPPLVEQHRIVARVDELMAVCNHLKADLAESRNRQARLASALITSALKAA